MRYTGRSSRGQVAVHPSNRLHVLQRHRLRCPHSAEESSVHRHGRSHARARNRRQHGDLQCGERVLLRPLPYAAPERLAIIWGDLRARSVINFPFAAGDMPDLREQATAFQAIAARQYRTGSPYVGEDGKPEQISAAFVTTNVFTVLGTRIEYGRNFADGDGTADAPPPRVARPLAGADAVPVAPPTRLPAMAILSHAFWQRRFGGDSSVIGKTIQIDDGPTQIVGDCRARREAPVPAGDRCRHAARCLCRAANRLEHRVAEQRVPAPRWPPQTGSDHRHGTGAARQARRRSARSFSDSEGCEPRASCGADAGRHRQGGPAGNPRADGRRDVRAAHRLRQRCEPAPRSRLRARA